MSPRNKVHEHGAEVIPKPFLDATTRNYTIEHGVDRHSSARTAKDGERELGAFKLPPFQRPSVWTSEQKVRFIESIWLHLPIASYVVNVDDQYELDYPCDDWLLDGQQRWNAIIEYVTNDLYVFDSTFGQLTKAQQRRFMNHPFPSIETRNLTPDQCRDVYDRLAYGGTNHPAIAPSWAPRDHGDPCGCMRCMSERQDPRFRTFMNVCPICGNKRCPHCKDHRFKCTGSNDPGQDGVLIEAESM